MEGQTAEESAIKRVVILGGGSAGWMSAAYLQARLGESVEIVVIASPSISSIGVGEATVPSIKEQFFDVLGVAEKEWMPACNATYKLGIRFENWNRPPSVNKLDYYYHLFGELPELNEIPLSHYWIAEQLKKKATSSFSKSCYPAHVLCENRRAPFDKEQNPVAPYAYHFDARKLVEFLQKWCSNREVLLHEHEVIGVEANSAGGIASVVMNNGDKVYGDFFVDCSGFRGTLIKDFLKEPFISFKSSLPTDSAVSINTPLLPKEEIRNFTTAKAMNSGWTWQTPLATRSGNGYVFASDFCSSEKAEAEIRELLGTDEPARVIQFESGRTRRAWVKNCVSIGLSSGFLEPLESTGLYFIYASLYQLVQHFPDKTMDPSYSGAFNDKVAYMIDDVRDFIIMHFLTAKRDDSPFWKYCRHDLLIPDSLNELLDAHASGIPIKRGYGDLNHPYSRFHSEFDRFWTNSNYQSVLCGVASIPKKPLPLIQLNPSLLNYSNKMFEKIRKEQTWLLENTIPHKEYIQLRKP